MTRFLHLGASLYVPATRPDLAAIANRHRYPFLRSVIFCTEDAIRREDVPRALKNLQELLRQLDPVGLFRFVRVCSPAILKALLGLTGVDRLNGFVLPKCTRQNLGQYLSAFPGRHSFDLMPTLETVEAFDPVEMAALRNELLQHPQHERILSLRIGGNDLFGLLGMRRPRSVSVHRTLLGTVIAQLVTTFRPYGFNLTGPVFEYLDREDLLAEEVRGDLAQGLFGKAAIHPCQVPLIEAQYRVRSSDLHMAEQTLKESAPPVFRLHNAMCEPATHCRWAALIRERASIYGVKETVRPV
jgi:citrate lyase beta subunit